MLSIFLGCEITSDFEAHSCSNDSKLMTTNLPSAQRIQIQNSLMYLYKHVAKIARQIEYFPGQVYTYYNDVEFPIEIHDGYYMDTGIVTIKLNDHKGADLVGANVTLGNRQDQIKAENRWNTSGTWLMPVPIGNQILTASNLPSDYPIPFAGQTVNVKNGSNYVEAKYYKLTSNVNMMAGPMMGDSVGSEGYAAGFKGSMLTKSGKTIESLVKGKISRYPTEGTDQGLSYCPDPNHTGRAKLEYIVGGDAANLFPAQETYTRSATPTMPMNLTLKTCRLGFGDVTLTCSPDKFPCQQLCL